MRDQDIDLLIKFDVITRKLRESNYDLSKIKIVSKGGSTSSYIYRKILQELEK